MDNLYQNTKGGYVNIAYLPKKKKVNIVLDHAGSTIVLHNHSIGYWILDIWLFFNRSENPKIKEGTFFFFYFIFLIKYSIFVVKRK